MRDYINLTSGLELAPEFPDARLVRIQSSHLEATALWNVIADLDYGFLIDAATIGCRVIDCGSRRGEMARAQWQGLPWIAFAYHRASLKCNRQFPLETAMVGNANCAQHFADAFHNSHKYRDAGIKKLRYVVKVTGSDRLAFDTYCGKSTMDGDYDALRSILLDCQNANP